GALARTASRRRVRRASVGGDGGGAGGAGGAGTDGGAPAGSGRGAGLPPQGALPLPLPGAVSQLGGAASVAAPRHADAQPAGRRGGDAGRRSVPHDVTAARLCHREGEAPAEPWARVPRVIPGLVVALLRLAGRLALPGLRPPASSTLEQSGGAIVA